MIWLPILSSSVFCMKARLRMITIDQDTTTFSKMNVSSFGGVTTPSANYEFQSLAVQIQVGTPPQPMSVLLDTGSHLLWIQSDNCTNCPGKSKFNPALSNTHTNFHNGPGSIAYADGTVVKFFINEDTIMIGGLALPNQAFGEAYSVVTDNYAYDGVMGLPTSYSSIFRLTRPLSQYFE